MAYLFDITAAKTRIPSVILLLVLGFLTKQVGDFFSINIPDLKPILPVLGTIGLILIVLEGSLELEINKSKLRVIRKSSLLAFIPLILLSFSLAYAFQYYGQVSFKIALANAIPFAVISSAIAIPSAVNLLAKDKEFITYESSLSDIFGVIFFNFITLNDYFNTESILFFIAEILCMLIVSFIATLALAFFLHKIKHHIKFIPIIILLTLIYAFSKIFHLPALIFILLFGLFMGNIDELRHYKFIQQFHPINFNKEVHKFKELTTEIAFLIRALFFLLFGFLIEIEEILNPDTILWAVLITIALFVLRMIFLKLFRLQVSPLVYLAPRGLITILLFLSIPVSQSIDLVNNSLVIQVIILTALVMMVGLMRTRPKEEQVETV
ncbi:cation:proton antiporter domain-containing protein [Arcticibacterium luteifluviistationis]